MSILFRFEDTYGMTDIFAAERGHGYFDPKMVRVPVQFDDFAVVFGLGSDVLALTSEDIKWCKSNSIDKIVFVFDTDNERGDKLNIVSEKFLASKIDRAVNVLSKSGAVISLYFVFTVYSAETVMLYQCLADDSLGCRVESYVHKVNTQDFHLLLLKNNFSLQSKRLTKRFRTFLDIDKLNDNIRINLSQIENNTSLDALSWLLSRCKDDSFLLSYEELLSLRNTVEGYFKEMLNNKDCVLRVTSTDKEVRITGSSDLSTL